MSEAREMHVVLGPLVARARELWSLAEEDYEQGATSHGYWAVLDLRSSASYREAAGSEFAFCRAEVFAQLCREIADRYEGVSIFKELGDGLLVRSEGSRPLFEMVAALDGVRRSWPGGDARRMAPNFDFTAAVNSGECTALVREGLPTDYLGSPIDAVARLSAFKDPKDESLLLVVEEATSRRIRAEVTREYPFLEFAAPELLPAALQKAGEEPLRFTRVRIDRGRFDGFRRKFGPLR